ncbi:MAG TPA: hypothetical protein DDW51_05995 [Cyanobacteria bacterium UBA11367]|nr:hypothetical protein [Cyanobacteria bacterium UBA11367]HBK65375.1 hypothetical protein [Cyanobacteria bacterium UBA11166]HBS72318.1 hypothetical protein [Cyanobacteria bacterium UBA11153]
MKAKILAFAKVFALPSPPCERGEQEYNLHFFPHGMLPLAVHNAPYKWGLSNYSGNRFKEGALSGEGAFCRKTNLFEKTKYNRMW